MKPTPQACDGSAAARKLSEKCHPPQWHRKGGPEVINGILRQERAAEQPSISPHPQPPGFTVSPAVRRLWTAALLAVLTLLCTSAGPALAQTAVAVVTEPEGVNLRGGPGTNFISLAVIPLGTELPVLGPKVNGDWVPVSYQGKLGFVSDQFVELKAVASAPQPPVPMPAAPPSPTPAPAAQQQQMRVNSVDGVNLRAGPGLDQRVLTVIPHNARVTVVGRSADGKWAQITYSGQSGWVDTQYLLPADTASDTSGARYIWPVTGRSITTNFGPGHPGIDIDQYPAGGNPVVAIAAGKVIFSGGNQCCSYGLYVKVEHRDGAVSLYAHLQSIDVCEGQEVSQGQTLGRSGSTGYSTGAHLHFEMHMNGSAVDPMGQLGR